ncbi:MAG TPA: SRPBCC family protein, partial [Actinomycetes bacterium]|nr:SRPBCC family protein [Actinomycetes bacterium]
MRRVLLPAAVAALATVGAYATALRRRQLCWGATSDEVGMPLPGDELLGTADLVATRAVSIRAAVEDVWPWLAQMGQGHGGLYSYDWVENLVG